MGWPWVSHPPGFQPGRWTSNSTSLLPGWWKNQRISNGDWVVPTSCPTLVTHNKMGMYSCFVCCLEFWEYRVIRFWPPEFLWKTSARFGAITMIFPPGNEHIPPKWHFEDDFPNFPRWDMLIPWRVLLFFSRVFLCKLMFRYSRGKGSCFFLWICPWPLPPTGFARRCWIVCPVGTA